MIGFEDSRGNPAGKNALTNLFAQCSRIFGPSEQRVERVERGSEPHIFESALKSVAGDDKTRRERDVQDSPGGRETLLSRRAGPDRLILRRRRAPQCTASD